MNQAHRAAREKWQQIIESQRAGGQTVAAYCRDHGVSQASFFAWKRRLRSPSQATEFVEVKTAGKANLADADGGEGQTPAIEVFLCGGRRLFLRRGFDRELLIELIHALEAMA
jgi:transposase-like protein